MKKILLTKEIEQKLLFSYLSENFLIESQSFISVEFQELKPYSLENKSIIFTSANGVKAFFKNQFLLKNTQAIYSVGKKTEKTLHTFGFQPTKVKKNAAELANYLRENKREEIFIHFGGNLSLDIFNDKKINYQKEIIYQTKLLYPKITQTYHAIVFFSPSGVESFIKNNSLENRMIFSIGETTSKTLKKYTKKRIFTSKKNTLTDLLEILSAEC